MIETKSSGETEVSKQSIQSKANDRYEVGYKKTPNHSKFKKGMSGNPKGRPKRKPGAAEAFHEVFDERIPATVEGKKVYIDGRKALFLNLRSRTNKGDLAAMRIFLNFCKLYGIKDPFTPNEQLEGLFAALKAGPVEDTPPYESSRTNRTK